MKELVFGAGQLIQLCSRFWVVGFAMLTVHLLEADSLTLTPGTVLIGQTGFPSGAIFQYARNGASSGNLNLPVLGDIPESLTVLSGELFVGDGSGRVSQIDPTTGNVISSFNTPSIALDSLGDFNGNLTALPSLLPSGQTGSTIYVYSAAGSFLQSIMLKFLPTNVEWNGLTSNGSFLYLADYNSGNLYKYSAAGALLSTIDTHLGAGLTGVSYDPSNNSLWVADGVTDMAYDFSTSGSLLSQFGPTVSPYGGIAVVPGGNVPEPTSLTLILFIAGSLLFTKVVSKLYTSRKTGLGSKSAAFTR